MKGRWRVVTLGALAFSIAIFHRVALGSIAGELQHVGDVAWRRAMRVDLGRVDADRFVRRGFVLAWFYAKEVNWLSYAGMGTSLADTGGFVAAGVLQRLVGGYLTPRRRAIPIRSRLFGAALAVLLAFASCELLATLFMRETYCRNIWNETSAKEAQP